MIVPFFVPSIASSSLPACRFAPRAAERAVPTACRESAPSHTIWLNSSISHEMIRAAGQIALTICRHSHICPSDEKSAFLYHITIKTASRPHAPHMRHGERGEVAAVCLPPLSHRSVWLLPALPIRRNGPDLRIFREWRISRLSCPITVLFYKHTE